jgi:hypothetical protein
LRRLEYFLAHRRDAVTALGLNTRELQFFGEDLGQLVEGEIHLHQVLALLGAPLALALAGLALADDVALLAVAGADALGVSRRSGSAAGRSADGDGDEVLALLADQSPLGEELAEVSRIRPLTICRKRWWSFSIFEDHDRSHPDKLAPRPLRF